MVQDNNKNRGDMMTDSITQADILSKEIATHYRQMLYQRLIDLLTMYMVYKSQEIIANKNNTRIGSMFVDKIFASSGSGKTPLARDLIASILFPMENAEILTVPISKPPVQEAQQIIQNMQQKLQQRAIEAIMENIPCTPKSYAPQMVEKSTQKMDAHYVQHVQPECYGCWSDKAPQCTDCPLAEHCQQSWLVKVEELAQVMDKELIVEN
jgi:hypothetical protein